LQKDPEGERSGANRPRSAVEDVVARSSSLNKPTMTPNSTVEVTVLKDWIVTKSTDGFEDLTSDENPESP
jgi:hypothetical protein